MLDWKLARSRGRSRPSRASQVAEELAAARRAGGQAAAYPLALQLATEPQAARADPDESGRSLEWKRSADEQRPGHSASIPRLGAPRTRAA